MREREESGGKGRIGMRVRVMECKSMRIGRRKEEKMRKKERKKEGRKEMRGVYEEEENEGIGQ